MHCQVYRGLANLADGHNSLHAFQVNVIHKKREGAGVLYAPGQLNVDALSLRGGFQARDSERLPTVPVFYPVLGVVALPAPLAILSFIPGNPEDAAALLIGTDVDFDIRASAERAIGTDVDALGKPVRTVAAFLGGDGNACTAGVSAPLAGLPAGITTGTPAIELSAEIPVEYIVGA